MCRDSSYLHYQDFQKRNIDFSDIEELDIINMLILTSYFIDM